MLDNEYRSDGLNECGFLIADFGIENHESKNGEKYWMLK